MQLSVKGNCIKCGACTQINTEIFEIYDDGAVVNNVIIDKYLQDCYKAVFECPVGAIVIN